MGGPPLFPSLLDGTSLLGMVPPSPPSPAREEGLEQQGKSTHKCPGSEVEKKEKENKTSATTTTLSLSCSASTPPLPQTT